ncbi:CsbD family protein [Streptomyces tateyamensis]|uniref:CsbD family protein n=1 Tax=Streptomyces tateyamensis TaxID=565073 RepID=UPI0015E89656|nr:CsbD family protein [Streptomyces tateyamensis]
MTARETIEHTGDLIKGVIKEYAGMVTGDEDLRAEGQADYAGSAAQRSADPTGTPADHCARAGQSTHSQDARADETSA